MAQIIKIGYATFTSVYGHCYFVIFIDDATRCTRLYLRKSKDEVVACAKCFTKRKSSNLITKIKALRPENGGEYVSQKFHLYLIENGIESQTSSADRLE